MAFVTIPDSIIQVGKAVTRTLFKTYVKDNLDDLNSRLGVVEGSSNKIIVYSEIVRNAASLEDGGTLTGLDYYRVPSSFGLIDCKVAIFTKGSLTGNLEIDIQKSTTPDFTTSASLFTTKPKIAYATASDYDESSNAVFDATTKDVVEGDYLRLDVSELPTGGIGRFIIYLIGEAS